MLVLNEKDYVAVADPNSPDKCSFKPLYSDDEASHGKRVPKRILHFSDGILEEYSSDEDDSDVVLNNSPEHAQVLPANMSQLPWMPWVWYQTVFVGNKALAACDYLGETLANFFGIISPKYEYEIEQYKKSIAEAIGRQNEDAELGGWTPVGETSSNQIPIQTEPQKC